MDEKELLTRHLIGLEACASSCQRKLTSLKGHIRELQRILKNNQPRSSSDGHATQPAP